MLNLPNSFNSWDGWRVQEIPKNFLLLYKALFSDETGVVNYKHMFDIGFKLYGTSFLWWSITGEIKRMDNEMEAKFGKEFLDFVRKKPLEDLITIEFNGEKKKINYLEYQQLRLDQLRGELYFRYLMRNPGDFLMILHQICPEVFVINDKDNNWINNLLFDREILEASDKEVIEKLKDKGIDVSNKDNIRLFLKKRRLFWEKWHGNFDELERVHKFINEVANNKMFQNNKGEFDKMKFISWFKDSSATAYARMKRRNEETRRNILESDLSPEEKKKQLEKLNPYLTKEDFGDNNIAWELFAGKNGLFEAFTGKEIKDPKDYFNIFGGKDNEGNINIFFSMAHNWNLSKGEMNPFGADIPYYELFKNFKYTGENTLQRTFDANISVFKEIVSKVGNLEKILWNASMSGSTAEIMDLHSKIYETLSGLVNQEYAWRANYILSQIVINFFAEHSIRRDPKTNWLGPFGWLYSRLVLGGKENIALSRLLTMNRDAYTMDTNAIRTYIDTLKLNKWINIDENGMWGTEQLNRVFEAGKMEYIWGDVIPQILWAVALFMFFTHLKKAMEEAEGKKK